MAHKKNTKYCKKIQEKLGIKIEYLHKCEYCSKSLSQQIDLQRHYTICKKKEVIYVENTYKLIIINLENKIIQYDEKLSFFKNQLDEKNTHIKQLEKQMHDVAISAVSRSTTSNKTQINNYIQQLQPITEEHLSNNVHHLTIDHIMKGPEGYAQYALEYPLKDRLICVDYARRKVKFKDNDGNVITDPEMTNLATKFFNSIKDKNKELILEYGNKLKENFGDEVDTIVKIFDYKSCVEKGSDVKKQSFIMIL